MMITSDLILLDRKAIAAKHKEVGIGTAYFSSSTITHGLSLLHFFPENGTDDVSLSPAVNKKDDNKYTAGMIRAVCSHLLEVKSCTSHGLFANRPDRSLGLLEM